MCKESILSLYSEINNSKFLKRYGKEYVNILRSLRKNVYFQGVKGYLSKDEIYQLCFEFLYHCFSKNMAEQFRNSLKKHINLYTKEEIVNAIYIMENDPNAVYLLSNVKLSLSEAYDLLESRGTFWYSSEDFWAINVLTTLDVSTAMTLMHEWGHRLYESYSHPKCFESSVYEEAFAFYNSYLLFEYCKKNGMSYDAKLALEEIDYSNGCSIDDFRYIESIVLHLKEKPQKDVLYEMRENEAFALNNYHHILGHLLAKYLYYDNENVPFDQKCDLLISEIQSHEKTQKVFRKIMNVADKDKINQNMLLYYQR